jgi:hypothetical protein
MLSKEKKLFLTKVTLAHIFTYFLCGMIFMNLLNYDEFIEALGFKSMEEISGLTVILGQIVRGILFGIVILLIKDSIIGKKLAWLKLWAILVIVGIISVYAPASGSIEGLIYLAPIEDMPPTSALSIFEIMVQPLLFSVIVTFQRKGNKTA